MFIEFDNFETFLNTISKVKAIKFYRITTMKLTNLIECYAQTAKNTYYINLYCDDEEAERTIDLLDSLGFTRVSAIRTWEG